jgi:dihydrodipicolinate synthase/N-acetylneuraminate lyase
MKSMTWLWKLWSHKQAGRVPVIAGAGSNNTAETVRLVTAAKEAGATAALVVTPLLQQTHAGRIEGTFSRRSRLRHGYHHLQYSLAVPQWI